MANSMKSLMIVLGLKNQDYLKKMAESKQELRAMQKDVKSMQANMQTAAKGMAAFGAAVTAAFGLTVKAAMEVEGTRTAFENLAKANGQSADEILKAMQEASKGTVSASDLMLAANRGMTLGVAKNSKEFASLMEIARDRARTMGMTTTKAFDDIVTGIGRGSPLILDNLGLTISIAEANEKYAKELGKTTSELTDAEKQQALLNEVLRQGQATIDKTAQGTLTSSEALQKLKASLVNVTATLGQALLPLIQRVSAIIAGVLEKIQDWIATNPDLAKTLTIIGTVLGVVAGALGGLLMVLPKLRLAWLAFNSVFVASPIGLIITAIGVLTAAGIALWQNWDKVKAFFVEAFEAIKSAVLNGVKAIMDSWIKFAGWIPGLKGKLEEAKQAIDGMIDAEKVAGDMRQLNSEVERLAASLTETIKGEIEKRRDAELAGIEKRRGDAQKEYDSAVEAINRKYGKLEDAEKEMTQSLSEQARERAQITKDSYDKEIDAAKDALNAKLAMLDEERAAKLAAFDEDVNDEVRKIQKQIEAIDAQADAEELARQRASEAQKLADLQAVIDTAQTEEEKAEAIQAYTEYETEVKLKELSRQRAAEKEALRDKIEDIREEAAIDRKSYEEELKEEYEKKKAAAKNLFETVTLPALMEEINTRKQLVDEALKTELASIEQQRLDALEIEGKKYTNSEKTGIFDMLDKEKDTVTAHYENQLTEAQLHVAAINEATAQLKNRTVTITTVHKSVRESSSSGGTSSSVTLPGFATGAVIKEPTLLTNLRTGAAVGVAGEAGIERLVPGNAGSNINISINNPVIRDRYDVKKLGKDLVAELRLAGVKI